MTRVEWSALSGDEAETVLSNLLYNSDERALRIRPSQGDYGIDVIVPAAADRRKWDVYQIKKFAQNLSANQKGQIEKSFRRVLVALVRRGVPLNDWYLVTPLDPTLHNLLDWFNQVPEEAIETLANDEDLKLSDIDLGQMRAWLEAPGRVIAWKGLSFCENLVADYPYVVDYYLHGGETRIRDAVAELSRLLGVDMAVRAGERAVTAKPKDGTAALLEPGEIRQHLERLDRVLDTDPHFRYGYSLDLHRPDLQPEPRLVAATQESISGGRWLTFKIYQRSAQSLDERPIPLELTFNFENSPDDREAFDVWQKYGKPLEVKASLKAGLPGGLHRVTDAGRIRLSPAEGQETGFRNRLRILDPAGAVVAEIGFAMSSTTGLDGTGTWAQGLDDSGTLAMESLIDVTAMSCRLNFTIEPLGGREASKVLGAVTFASRLASPNVIQIAGEYGPFFDFTPIGLNEPLVDPALARFIFALATIQTAIPTPIVIPDVAAVDSDELGVIRRAAALIGGHTMVGTWKPFTIEKHAEIELEPGGHYHFAVIEPLLVSLNGRDLVLGCVEKKTLSALVDSVNGDRVRLVPHRNDVAHFDFLPEMPSAPAGKEAVRYRPAVDPGEPSGHDQPA
jgi:hypothetical protein